MNVAYILSSATGGGFKSFINSLDELMKKGLSPLVVLPMENEIHTLLSSRGIPTIIGIGHYIAQKLHIPHIYHVREYGDLDFGYKYFPTRKHFIKQLSDDYSIFITKDIQKYFLQDQNSKSSVRGGTGCPRPPRSAPG